MALPKSINESCFPLTLGTRGLRTYGFCRYPCPSKSEISDCYTQVDVGLYRNNDILLQTLFQHLSLVPSRLLDVPNIVDTADWLHKCHLSQSGRSCKLEVVSVFRQIEHHIFTSTRSKPGKRILNSAGNYMADRYAFEWCSRRSYTREMQGRYTSS